MVEILLQLNKINVYNYKLKNVRRRLNSYIQQIFYI